MAVRQHGEHLFSRFEEAVLAENHGAANSLVLPYANQINMNGCRVKAQLVNRLSGKSRLFGV